MPLAPEMDTAGFLTRDPALWATAAKALYLDNVTISRAYPKLTKVYKWPNEAQYPGDYLVSDFFSKLSAFLGAQTMNYDVDQCWKESHPNSTIRNIGSLLNLPYGILTAKEQANLVRNLFYKDYAAAHGGRKAFVEPAVLAGWKFGDTYPDSAIAEAVKNITIFADWFAEHGLKPDPDTL
jgi:hypothetical protein